MKVRYTVPSDTTRAAYVGNGVTTNFSAPFNFFDDSDLYVVLVNDTTAVETVQVLTTNYTVTGGGGSTGSITMLVAPPTGNTLVIERNVPFTQEIDLEPNDPFPAEVTEEGFDRATMLAQQNRLEIQKSPKLPPTYDPDSDPEIRIPVPVAGKVLVGNTDEDGWDNADIEDVSTADIPAVISGLANRNLLEYDSGSVVWRNQTLATVLKRMLTTAGDIAVNIAGTVSRLAIGSAGQVLVVSGGLPAWQTVTTPTVQEFTSGTAATYTTPANVKWIKVYEVGAGGGGGGTGGSTGPAGATGGTTTFNSITAIGGNGGTGGTSAATGSGGVGGTGGSGTAIRINGGTGAAAPGTLSVALAGTGGMGGGSAFFGGGGAPPHGNATGGAGATNTGGGGSGASGSATFSIGGAGGGGGEYAEFIINNPSATYTYTVGAGGAGGIGTGSGAATGGAGAAGRIIVEEYYI